MQIHNDIKDVSAEELIDTKSIQESLPEVLNQKTCCFRYKIMFWIEKYLMFAEISHKSKAIHNNLRYRRT